MAAKTQSATAVVKREIEPIGQGSLLQTSPEDTSIKEIAATYAILSFLEKVIDKRKKALKPLLQEAAKTGRQTDNGGHNLDLGDANIVNTRRVSSAPEEGPLRALLETRGIELAEAYDEVKTLVLNPSKLSFLSSTSGNWTEKRSKASERSHLPSQSRPQKSFRTLCSKRALSKRPKRSARSVSGAETMQIERLSAADYVPREGLVYVDTNKLHPLYEKLAFNSNLILVGPKGVGKSLSVAAYCAKKNYPVITFDCSEDVRRAQLIGMFVLRGNETPFVLGPLSTAFEVANEAGHCVLILEEINALSPQMQKVLNSTTDFRRTIEVPEARCIFKLKSGAKLWVVGSMNTSAYGGVYSLNEDLKSRFRMLPVEYPKLTDEREIVTEVLSKKNITVEKVVLDKVFTFAKETRQNATDYSLSTRDVVQIAEDIQLVGLNKALLLALGKFEGSDREMLFERIRSIFGLTPKGLTD